MKQFIAGVAVGAVGALTLLSAAWAATQDEYASLDLLGDAVARVHAVYVHEISVAEVVDKALHGLMAELDPHSSYMNAEELAQVLSYTHDNDASIGLELTERYGQIEVITPMDDTPAAAAGLKPGDHIIAVDGEQVEGQPLYSVIAKLRGPLNSKITLSVQHAFAQKPVDISMIRKMAENQFVKSRRIDNIGYIRVSSFGEKTDKRIEDAVTDLKNQIGPALKGYVIDLRNDPGGLLDQAVSISDEFLERGAIVSLRGRTPENNTNYSAKPGDITDGKPIIVLINEGTASGAEIIAGALQDNHRATIVGMKSFGTGTLQTIIPLGKGALRLTTAEFYRASGTEIQTIGITPDIAVAANPADANDSSTSYRQSESRLPGHFPAQSVTQTANALVIYPDKSYDDFQLSYALDKLNGKKS